MSNGPDPDLLAEHVDRLWSSLQTARGRSSAVRLGLLTLVWGFFALGFLPYLLNIELIRTVHESQQEFARREKAITRDRKRALGQVDRYDRLEDATRKLAEDNQRELYERAGELGQVDRAVLWSLHADMVETALRPLRREHFPYHGLDLLPEGLWTEIEQYMLSYVSFARGQESSYSELQSHEDPISEVPYFWGGVREITERARAKTDSILSQTRDDLEALEEERRVALEAIAGSEEKLETIVQMQNLDTPAGSLHVSFAELVLLFPSISLVMFGLAWSARLRRDALEDAFLDAWERRDTDGVIANRRAWQSVDVGRSSLIDALLWISVPAVTVVACALFRIYPESFASIESSGQLAAAAGLYQIFLATSALGAVVAIGIVGRKYMRRRGAVRGEG